MPRPRHDGAGSRSHRGSAGGSPRPVCEGFGGLSAEEKGCEGAGQWWWGGSEEELADMHGEWMTHLGWCDERDKIVQSWSGTCQGWPCTPETHPWAAEGLGVTPQGHSSHQGHPATSSSIQQGLPIAPLQVRFCLSLSEPMEEQKLESKHYFLI